MKYVAALFVGWVAGGATLIAVLMKGEFEQRQGWPKP